MNEADMSEACLILHEYLSLLPKWGADFDTVALPKNGICVMFEKGESAHETSRIVHVGTHIEDDQLPRRLAEHFRREKKDRSIFRKHVGRAMLNRHGDPFLDVWNLDLTPRAMRDRYAGTIDWDRMAAVERSVTEYLAGNITFSVYPVNERIRRDGIKKAIIGTIASCPICGPSKEWLGNHHPDLQIVQSGLWNIQGMKGKTWNAEGVRRFVADAGPG